MITAKEREAFTKIVKSRRSVREYEDREIAEDSLRRILEIGHRAASAANRQPWYFVVARRRDNHPLYKLLYGRGFQGAPALIMGLADRSRAWTRKGDGANYAWVDVAIALTEMILAATAEGLGTCWVAAFDPAEARRILSLPDYIDPVSLVTLGYPVSPLKVEEEKDRRGSDEVVRWGAWRP